MFFEISMKRLVVIQPEKLYNGVLLTRSIFIQLLDDVKELKCSAEHGYYITPMTINSIGEGKIRSLTGEVVFPLDFTCIVFKPIVNEILEGEVTNVITSGCALSTGPLNHVFLHATLMGDFKYVNDHTEFPMFKTADQRSDIKVGTLLRYRIKAIKWVEELRDYNVLGSIEENYLGCIENVDSEMFTLFTTQAE